MARLVASMCWLCLLASLTAAQALAQAQLQLGPSWSNLLSGQKCKIPIQIAGAPAGDSSRIAWRLQAEHRVLARDELQWDAGRGQPAVIIQLQAPQIRDELVLACRLVVELIGPDGQLQASSEKPLWIFGADPFSRVRPALGDWPVYLFDPAGTTIEALRGADLAFQQVARLDSLEDKHQGLLLIGEGISLAERPGIDSALVSAIERGLSVCCLAPADGFLSLPGVPDSPYPTPDRIQFTNVDIIRRFDKRLDSTDWVGGVNPIRSGIQLGRRGTRIVGEVVTDQSGWPWLEAEFSAPAGKLIVCGLALVANWDEGPVPREVLTRIIEDVLSFSKRRTSSSSFPASHLATDDLFQD